jgi:hypothetical protein
MADNKPVKPSARVGDTVMVTLPMNVATPTATEAVLSVEPRNLTREMLAQELGEEEARKRIP